MQVREMIRKRVGGVEAVCYAVREFRAGRRPLERTVTVSHGSAWCRGCANTDCSHARAALRRHATTEAPHA